MKKKNQGLGFIVGTLFGATIAGVSALLYAPKSGKEMRKDIEDKAEDAKEAAEDYMDIAKEKGNEMVDTVQKTGSKYKDKVEEATEHVKESVHHFTHKSSNPEESNEDSEEKNNEKADEKKNEEAEKSKKESSSTQKEQASKFFNSDELIDADSLKEDIDQRTMQLARDEEESEENNQDEFDSIQFPKEDESEHS